MNDNVNVRDVGFEALRVTMALEIKGKTGKSVLGEEDWGGLKRPADVIAIAVDHTDDAAWRAGLDWLPRFGE